ncbi:unnamed protein product [Ectocarpus fasciculatus]
MPAPTDANGKNTLLPPISAVPTSTLLQPGQDHEGFSPSPSYGAFVPVTDEFLPLGGGDENAWGQVGRVYASEMSEEEEEDVDPGRISATTLIYLCALCSSLTSVLLGYDVGVMSAAILDIEEDMDLSPLQAEILVGSLNVIAAFGGLIAGKASDALGRKMAIAIACGIFITGAGGMTVSMTYTQLLTGRLLTGLGVGCGFVVAPVYITEITPPHIRGKLVALTDIMINIGILLGYITGFACQELIAPVWLKWRIMLGLGILPPAVIVISLTFLPESPRWLISRGRIREGYQVLGRVIDDPIEAKETLQAIVKSVQSHGNAANGGDKNEEPGWMEVLWPSDKVVRAALFVGLGLGFWQQASGSEAAVYYSPHVLEAAGMTSRGLLLAGTCMVGVFKLLGEVLAAVLIERVGRRPLFLVSSITSTLTLLLIAQSFFLEWSAVPTLVVLCAFMFCFSIGLGPLTFVVAAEVFPMQVRGKAVSLVVFVNRLLSGLIATSFLSISQALTTGGAFLMFALISMASVFFYYFCVPETRGKTLEQIADDLAAEFHLKKDHHAWDTSVGHGSDLMNLRVYPTNHRLVSSLSSGKLVAVVSSSDLQLMREEKGQREAGIAAGVVGGGSGTITRSRSWSASFIY